ncbi:hypothetical protein Ancab_033978 [Ancistrocladus abbreviatus]
MMGRIKKETEGAELRREGLDDYDVWPMGGKLMLIRPPGEVNLVNEESGLEMGGPIAIDAATKARTRLDIARLAVLTPVLHHISLTMSLTIDEDDFPIFIFEEGRAFYEKVGPYDANGSGSSEDSSKAFFPSLASLSVVSESVGDDLATRKLTDAALHWKLDFEVQKTLLVINDSADVIWEDPVCIDGSASGKFKWCWKFRDDRERMDGGEAPIFVGTEVDNLSLDMDPNCADLGDPKSLWAATENLLGLLVAT